MTLNRKKANFRGHYVSNERKFGGHLKKSWAKSPFFEGHGKPCPSPKNGHGKGIKKMVFYCYNNIIVTSD